MPANHSTNVAHSLRARILYPRQRPLIAPLNDAVLRYFNCQWCQQNQGLRLFSVLRRRTIGEKTRELCSLRLKLMCRAESAREPHRPKKQGSLHATRNRTERNCVI